MTQNEKILDFEDRYFLGVLTGFVKFRDYDINGLDDGIEISNDLRLRRITEEEENILLRERKIRYGDYEYLAFKITTRENVLNTDFNVLKLGLLALRLHKKGDIYIQGIAEKKNDKFPIWQYTTLDPRVIYGYRIIESDINVIRDIHKKLCKINFNNEENFWLKIPCDRFDRYFSNYRPRDKLIDLMIGYESLFLKGSKQGSKSSPIAKKCSELLETYENREKVYEKVKFGYDLRNKIVHSSKDYSKDDIWSVLPNLEEYMRESLRRKLL